MEYVAPTRPVGGYPRAGRLLAEELRLLLEGHLDAGRRVRRRERPARQARRRPALAGTRAALWRENKSRRRLSARRLVSINPSVNAKNLAAGKSRRVVLFGDASDWRLTTNQKQADSRRLKTNKTNKRQPISTKSLLSFVLELRRLLVLVDLVSPTLRPRYSREGEPQEEASTSVSPS